MFDEKSTLLLRKLYDEKVISLRNYDIHTDDLFRLYKFEKLGLVRSEFVIKGNSGHREFYPTELLNEM